MGTGLRNPQSICVQKLIGKILMTTAGLEPATFWYPYMGNIRQSKPNALPLRQVVLLYSENIYNMYLYTRSLILAIDLLVVLLSDVLLFTIFVGFSS